LECWSRADVLGAWSRELTQGFISHSFRNWC
jgi:hypothetical protein